MLPIGGKICAKCRRELSITIPLPNPWTNKNREISCGNPSNSRITISDVINVPPLEKKQLKKSHDTNHLKVSKWQIFGSW